VGDFVRLDRDSGVLTTLSSIRWWWTPQEREIAEQNGLEAYWTFLGASTATHMQDAVEGADQFVYKGRQAADIYFSGPATLVELSEPYSIVGFMRAVEVENGHLLQNCFVMLPTRVAEGWDGTARAYPEKARICQPFFDSLEIKDQRFAA
jgi:hypothetical protein